MRLFFAVEIPPDVQAALEGLRPAGESRDYRWTPAEQLHVTLAFLGNQPQERLEALRSLARSVASVCAAGVLHVGQPGSFGTRTAPRVLWIGLNGHLASLHALQQRLSTALRQAVDGFEDDRAFHPHVTLARRRASATAGPPPGWPPLTAPDPNTFSMHSLTLFESRLSSRGATYVSQGQFPLTGSSALS